MRWPANGMMSGVAQVLGVAILAAFCSVATASDGAKGADGKHVPDLSGVWQIASYERAIRTVDGKMPPLKPEARKLYEKNLVALKQPKPREDMTRCVPPGTPRVLWAPFPVQIVQTARKVIWLHEYQHLIRHVYMDEPLPSTDDFDPAFMGVSAGRWEGDTLVIETIGFNEKTVLDRDGMPHSPEMRVTERVRLIDDGKRLEDRVTIDDPKTYTSVWTARVVFERKTGLALKEYHCVLRYDDY